MPFKGRQVPSYRRMDGVVSSPIDDSEWWMLIVVRRELVSLEPKGTELYEAKFEAVIVRDKRRNK